MSNEITSLKDLLVKPITQKVDFMGSKVEIRKLTVKEVQDIQSSAKDMEKDENQGFGVLMKVVRVGCPMAVTLTDEDFSGFPLDELSKLSNAIMKHSGIAGDQGK